MSVTWEDWDEVCFGPRSNGKTLTQLFEMAERAIEREHQETAQRGTLKRALANFPDVNTYYAHRDNDRQFEQ